MAGVSRPRPPGLARGSPGFVGILHEVGAPAPPSHGAGRWDRPSDHIGNNEGEEMGTAAGSRPIPLSSLTVGASMRRAPEQGEADMDATRARRTRDRARKLWYAGHRQWRFARHLSFVAELRCSQFSPSRAAQSAEK